MGAVEENHDERVVSEKERVDTGTGTGQGGSLAGGAGETLDKPSNCVQDGDHVLDDDHGQVGDHGDVVAEEEVVEERRKVESELISNNVALIHLLKGNIGIGVMAMPRSDYVDEHDTNDIDSGMHLFTLENMIDIKTVISQYIIKKMPSALVSAGLALGTAGLSIVAIITIHCMHMLVGISFSF